MKDRYEILKTKPDAESIVIISNGRKVYQVFESKMNYQDKEPQTDFKNL